MTTVSPGNPRIEQWERYTSLSVQSVEQTSPGSYHVLTTMSQASGGTSVVRCRQLVCEMLLLLLLLSPSPANTQGNILDI